MTMTCTNAAASLAPHRSSRRRPGSRSLRGVHTGPLNIAQPAGRFLRNLLAVAVGMLALGLILYIFVRPGMAEMLMRGGWPAWRLFLRQGLINGLPVVLLTTWAGAVWHAAIRIPEVTRGLADPVLRIVAFAVLHVVSYLVAADWFGSFDGDLGTALRTVAPTLARAAFLENISGVYLYAVLVIALPSQVAAIRRGMGNVHPVPMYLLWMIALASSLMAIGILTSVAAALSRY